ncbi:MAG: hypothetical protein KTR26_14260 [Flammeovirgaceae bacterium]|nr:hypothetical protein [Flammeovirgaceae bacterium]
MQNRNQWLVAILIILIGTLVAYAIVKNDNKRLANTRQLKLQSVHNRAINKLTISIGKFAGMVSGMKSFMNLSPKLPSDQLLQKFVRNQIDDIGYQDSIVVSYVDTLHVFQYCFSKTQMDPANLVGKSVKKLRDSTEIKSLNELLKTDSLRIFNPINLFEGWVGIPINFRVNRNGVTTGYVAPIINFKTIIQPIYDDQVTKDYVFQFVSPGKYDFDREIVHDGSKVYNQNSDPEYYKNYDIDPSSFIYSNIEFYGLKFTIGTAFKNEPSSLPSISGVAIGVYISFIVFVLLLTHQINQYRSFNNKIQQANLLLEKTQDEISNKNEELSTLNSTKDRFFSIIGHDIKGPLNSIKGLLSILLHENIKDAGLQGIISKLQDSVKNTVNLLNNLLNWARSQTGDLKFTKIQFGIKEAINEAISTLIPQAEAKFIKVKFDLVMLKK